MPASTCFFVGWVHISSQSAPDVGLGYLEAPCVLGHRCHFKLTYSQDYKLYSETCSFTIKIAFTPLALINNPNAVFAKGQAGGWRGSSGVAPHFQLRAQCPLQSCSAGRLPRSTTNLLYVDIFAVTFAIAKQCFKWFFFRCVMIGSLLWNWFLLYDDQQTVYCI